MRCTPGIRQRAWAKTSLNHHQFHLPTAAAIVKRISTVVRAAKPPAPAELHAKEMADATKELMHLQKEPADWPMQEGNYAGWRYSPL